MLRSLLLCASLSFWSIPSSLQAEDIHTFTDTNGRHLEGEMIDLKPEGASVRRKNGHTVVLPLEKLSEADRKYVADWKAKKAKESEDAKRAVEIPVKLKAYCDSQLGQKVGNGECWTLADEAFKSCGLRRPGGQGRVWGREVKFKEKDKKDPPQVGDIVEFRSAKFTDGSSTGPEHTAIIIKLGRRGKFTVAEQNWSGVKKVHEREMDPAGLKSGELIIYRPE